MPRGQERALRDWPISLNPEKKIKSKSTLNGQVVGINGSPIRGAEITLYKIGSMENYNPPKFTTRLDGNFAFKKCANAAYKLEIESGHRFQNEFLILNNNVNLGQIKLTVESQDNYEHNFFQLGFKCSTFHHKRPINLFK